jgi:hypothetical protein
MVAGMEPVRTRRRTDGQQYTDGVRIRLHRRLTGAPDDLEVDHINENKLDNRRSNLDVVTKDENMHRWAKRRRMRLLHQKIAEIERTLAETRAALDQLEKSA